MYTEDEARRKKWCPFSRVIPGTLNGYLMKSSGVPSYNRIHENGIAPEEQPTWDRACNCIASDCMAWRWADNPHWEGGNLDAITPEEGGCKMVRHGFCSLAGGA